MPPSRVSIPRYETGVIGLPPMAVVLTNTERNDAACARRWWFRYAEGLTAEPSTPLRFGNGWHAFQEDQHRWWRDTDSPYEAGFLEHCPWCREGGAFKGRTESGVCGECLGTGKGVIERVAVQWRRDLSKEDEFGHPLMPRDEVEQQIERLRRVAEGYLAYYGNGPYTSYRVVGVELAVARVIRNPWNGRVYKPMVDLVLDEAAGVWRMASSGEASGARPLAAGSKIVRVRWPWYQSSRFDLVLAHRNNGQLYIGEFKSSASPKRLLQGLLQDTQTPGYCWVFDGMRKRIAAAGVDIDPDAPIGGVFYDVVSSTYQHDPQVLKAKKEGDVPKLSTAKNRNTPSWRYMREISRLGIDPGPYAEHIADLASRVDRKFYARDWFPVGPERIESYEAEIYGVAQRLSAMRRTAGMLKDLIDVDVHFPRTPVCRMPGASCPYKTPCVIDGEDARRNFKIDLGIRWSDERDNDEAVDDGEELGW